MRNVLSAIGSIALMFLSGAAGAELEPACAVNSPERNGELGCTLVENKSLPGTIKSPLFWHIDRYDSGESARAVATGTKPRRALAVIVYDASQPPTTRTETGEPPLASCEYSGLPRLVNRQMTL
jgi:hypothetical protein